MHYTKFKITSAETLTGFKNYLFGEILNKKPYIISIQINAVFVIYSKKDAGIGN